MFQGYHLPIPAWLCRVSMFVIRKVNVSRASPVHSCYYCLPTPMTLASGGGGDSDLPSCGTPASPSIWPAVQSLRLSLPTNLGVSMWVQLNSRCVSVLQRGHSGDRCVVASTLCKYDLRKGD